MCVTVKGHNIMYEVIYMHTRKYHCYLPMIDSIKTEISGAVLVVIALQSHLPLSVQSVPINFVLIIYKQIVKHALKDTSIKQITVYKGQPPFSQ